MSMLHLIARFSISTRLLVGFASLLVLTLLMGGFAYRTMSELSLLVEQTARPMMVLDKAMKAKTGVVAMHAETEYLALSNKPEDVEQSLVTMARLEREVRTNLLAVMESYPGDPADVTAALQALDERSQVRETLVSRIQAGDKVGAIRNVRERGVPAEQVVQAKLSTINAVARKTAEEIRHSAGVAQADAQKLLALTLAGLVLLGYAIAFVITRSIRNPLDVLRGRMVSLAEGDLSVDVPFRGEQTELGAMGRAVEVLKQASMRLEAQRWLKANVARIGAELQAATTDAALVRIAMEAIVPVIGASAGVFYLWDQKERHYAAIGGYGVRQPMEQPLRFGLGEGAVGQCAISRSIIHLPDFPEGAARISAGLCEIMPRSVLLVPVASSSGVLAVLEFGTLTTFSSEHESILAELAPLIALDLEIIDRQKTETLLLRTQQQAEELRASEEELRAQSEQLQAANEELRASEEELKAQREELETTNEELKEKTCILEEQASQLERARREAEDRALERDIANRSKTEFLANMSHELRTPLNSLLILARSLADNDDGNLSPDQVDSATIIHESGSHLLHLINDILDLSKIEAGKMSLCVTEIALRQLADTVHRRFRSLAAAKGLEIVLEFAQDLCPALRSDMGKVEQVLSNLIGNAIKFTEQGRITIRFSRSEAGDAALAEAGLGGVQSVAISVTDSGIGIPADKLERIFAAFEQVDSSASRRFGGTGLGLTISRKLARFLGGDIVVASGDGQGSTFTLVLPQLDGVGLAESQFAGPITTRQPAKLPFMTSEGCDDRDSILPQDETILIIEDDPAFACIICNLARKRGFKCLVAPDGPRGLDLARCYRPTAIVLDVGLPGMDGWAVIGQLKEIPETRHIPVHFMSATDASERGAQLGAVGYLTKPVTKEQIEEALERLRRASNPDGRRILLVDDDAASRRAVLALLKDRPVEIVEAVNGGEALAHLRSGDRFDCIILDLGLPDLNGQNLLDQCVRENLSLPPVITYTACELSDEETLALREHTDSIIIKGSHAPARLTEEVSLFLKGIEGCLTPAQRLQLNGRQSDERRLADRTVLVVDDDMRNAFALSKALRRKGLKVLMAQDGQKALAQLEDAPSIDIVLMDVMMPGMDGYQTMREIRRMSRFKALPIIALTAKAMAGDREKCLEAGANNYLSKPVEIGALLAMMSELVKADA